MNNKQSLILPCEWQKIYRAQKIRQTVTAVVTLILMMIALLIAAEIGFRTEEANQPPERSTE